MQYTDIHLQCCPHHLLYMSPNILKRHVFIRRGCLSVAVPASHALPLPPQLICSDVHIHNLLWAKRGENHWQPNLVNMVDVETPLILTPESVSWYDMLSSNCLLKVALKQITVKDYTVL